MDPAATLRSIQARRDPGRSMPERRVEAWPRHLILQLWSQNQTGGWALKQGSWPWKRRLWRWAGRSHKSSGWCKYPPVEGPHCGGTSHQTLLPIRCQHLQCWDDRGLHRPGLQINSSGCFVPLSFALARRPRKKRDRHPPRAWYPGHA